MGEYCAPLFADLFYAARTSKYSLTILFNNNCR